MPSSPSCLSSSLCSSGAAASLLRGAECEFYRSVRQLTPSATRAALAAAGILAITAFLLSARRPYTLLSASNLVFLALAALFAPPLAE